MALKSVYQHRTADQVYLFQVKDPTTVSLKIYDISGKRLFKTALETDPTTIQSLFTSSRVKPLLDLFEQKKLLPPNPSASQPLQDALKELDHLLNLVKLEIPLENRQAEPFTCPITLEILKDPVIDNCGHTFERGAIKEHLKKNKTCPLSRQPITTLTPNLQLKQTLEAWQAQDPIPTFNLFKKSNETLALRNLESAQAYMQEQEYQEALEAYQKAFQFTQKWQDYQTIPLLFQRMKDPLKALLATLHLVKYQLQAQEIEKAAQLLSSCLQENPRFKIPLTLILLHLYALLKQTGAAIPIALDTASACQKDHPGKAILLYQYILRHDPTQWQIYTILSDLLLHPQDKAHLLLTGACHALENNEYIVAEKLCLQAEQASPNPFLDRLVHLKLLSQDPKQLQTKLLALGQMYETQKDLKQIVKAYRHLTTLDLQPSYCQKILKAQSQLPKPQKALPWALQWLQALLQRKDLQAADAIAQGTLQLFPALPIPLYETLAALYADLKSPKLQEILNCLAKAHQDQGNKPQAEKIYREAYEKFPTLEQALALAKILHANNNIPQAVPTYYEAATLAFLQGSLTQLGPILTELQQIDPLMQHLNTTQKVHLLTQKHLHQLSKELKESNSQVSQLSMTLDKTARELDTTRQDLNRINDKLATLQKELDHLKSPPPPAKILSLPSIAFGKAKWDTYFGDIGEEPPLPADIGQILQSPCPFWPGKKIEETHLLVLIPTSVNGQPLTLKTLGELAAKPKQGPATQYKYFNLGEYQDQPVTQSYWVLMTRDVIEGSRNKTYADQKQLVATHAQKTGVAYELPKILEATTCIFLHHVSTGQKLYPDSPGIYTRCQELYHKQNGWALVVGGFAAGGLYVNIYCSSSGECVGVGCRRKF